MKTLAILGGLFAMVLTAAAAVNVDDTPASLVTSETTIAASAEKAVFEFALTADDSETLSSVAVTVNSTTATTADLAAVTVYKDDGDGSFDSGDSEAGSATTVNIGSSTTVSITDNEELDGSKFFVVLETSSAWSGTDSVTVTLDANGINTSANAPTTSAVTTAALSFELDTVGPVLQSAVAKNKADSTAGLEAGDMVVLTFSEATNKPAINASNIASVLELNNSHEWLDGADAIGSAVWNSEGTELTVTLSAGTSLPTVAVGDNVTIDGDVIEDKDGNEATGSKAITGSFAPATSGGEEEEEFGKVCGSGIVNGKLYKIGSESTVYLAAACRLKPFRGAAVFHARGHKFQNIITLSAMPSVEISSEPALPAGGTLVKGSDMTVWFVTEDGKRKGFTSEKAFKGLGFAFGAVKQIADSDLAYLETDADINEASTHPMGAVIKCGNSATVYMVKGSKKHAFTNPTPYLERGHTWDAVATIDCSKFSYQDGENIAQ